MVETDDVLKMNPVSQRRHCAVKAVFHPIFTVTGDDPGTG